MFNKYVRFLTS